MKPLELPNNAVGNFKMAQYFENQLSYSFKKEKKTTTHKNLTYPYNLANWLLDINPWEMRTYVCTDAWMFTAALFLITSHWRNPHHNRWTDKQSVACSGNGLLSSNETGLWYVTNTGGSQKHDAKWNRARQLHAI